MREFMTKVSDYFNERRNNPERQEDRLAVVIVGVAAVVVIVLLLLVLWGHMARERRDKEAQAADNKLTATTYEEHAAEYMAQNDGQDELRQEYLTSIDSLGSQVEELLTALTQVEQNLFETMEQYREGDSGLLEEIASLYTQITDIVQNLYKTQTVLYDLVDIVQVMDEETIPIVQAQIVQIQEEMNQMHADITDLRQRIVALEREDVKLWESIGNVEKAIERLSDRIEELERTYKIAMMKALNQIGTFFASVDGTITHNAADNAVSPDGAAALSLNSLYQGILQSQSVDHLADIRAAVDNNLSLGTAAWVNGSLIIGNGADNKNFYDQGYADGKADAEESAEIEYIYHEHAGDSAEGGGCYTEPAYHQHIGNAGTYGGCYTISVPDALGCKKGYHTVKLQNGFWQCTDCGCRDSEGVFCSHSGFATSCGLDGVVVGWDLGCGKTTSTIEKAIIVYK
ncbi:MAG: hypothetical protein J1F42_09860 [Lachnospiraceae bacterium]|nr:hypothetical protein [Lachnospiraceae bacterium]